MSGYQTVTCSITSWTSLPHHVTSNRGQPSTSQADQGTGRSPDRPADVQDVITRQLEDGATCQLAADLAEAIAAEWDTSDDEHEFDIKRIESWKSQRGAEDFDIWFADLGDTRTRSFAIALAVLNGLPYDAVAKGARELYRRFDKPPYLLMASADDVQPERLRPFRTSRREWLHKLQAQIRETKIHGPYGHSPPRWWSTGIPTTRSR